MRAVGHKRGKERHDIEEDVSNTFDDSVRLLALIERVPQSRVDSYNIVYVPKHLLDKVGAAMLRDDVLRVERSDPYLSSFISTRIRRGLEDARRVDTPCRVRNRARCR